MKHSRIPAIAVGAALIVSACAPQQKKDIDAQASAAPAATSAPTTYRCDSGMRIIATYPNTESATIQYNDSTYDLRIAISADGARYVGHGLEWWTKGSGAGSQGTLSELKDGDTGGKRLQSCTAEGA
jgi:membrane-bound inhibitor of C-type lysozyme